MHGPRLGGRLGFDVLFARGGAEKNVTLCLRKERRDPIHFGAGIGQLPKIRAALSLLESCLSRVTRIAFGIDWITKGDDSLRFGVGVLPERAQRGQRRGRWRVADGK